MAKDHFLEFRLLLGGSIVPIEIICFNLKLGTVLRQPFPILPFVIQWHFWSVISVSSLSAYPQWSICDSKMEQHHTDINFAEGHISNCNLICLSGTIFCSKFIQHRLYFLRYQLLCKSEIQFCDVLDIFSNLAIPGISSCG